MITADPRSAERPEASRSVPRGFFLGGPVALQQTPQSQLAGLHAEAHALVHESGQQLGATRCGGALRLLMTR